MIDRKVKIYDCNKQRHCRFNKHCDDCHLTSDKTFAVNHSEVYEFEKMVESKDGQKVAIIFKRSGETIDWDEESQRRMMYLTDGFTYTDKKSMEIHRKAGRLK